MPHGAASHRVPFPRGSTLCPVPRVPHPGVPAWDAVTQPSPRRSLGQPGTAVPTTGRAGRYPNAAGFRR